MAAQLLAFKGNPKSVFANSASGSLIWIGALSAAAAVGFGAFGAHGLRNVIKDPLRMKAWETAAHYHLLHSVAVCVAALVPGHAGVRAGYVLLAGTAVFSGSIYALVLLDRPSLGALTPLGGLALIGGWLYLAHSARSTAQ